METKNSNIISIVLAAGQGKRMKNDGLPKVLALLDGKPLISYVLDSLHLSGVSARPVIVVGYQAEKVMTQLGPDYTYAFQAEQRGTGHAVMCAKSKLANEGEHVVVLCGDMPLVTSETIQRLTTAHRLSDSVLTMATVIVEDFNEWRQSFSSFGRIVRSPEGDVEAIVERKDATVEQIRITECNPSFFCFNTAWLQQNLGALQNTNAQGEYYLTDLVAVAKAQGYTITTIEIDPREALGINTPSELILASQLKRERTAAIV